MVEVTVWVEVRVVGEVTVEVTVVGDVTVEVVVEVTVDVTVVVTGGRLVVEVVVEDPPELQSCVPCGSEEMLPPTATTFAPRPED